MESGAEDYDGERVLWTIIIFFFHKFCFSEMTRLYVNKRVVDL